MPFNDFAGRYFNICFVLAVNSLKMRRRMIEEVHPNGDAIKPRNGWHRLEPPSPPRTEALAASPPTELDISSLAVLYVEVGTSDFGWGEANLCSVIQEASQFPRARRVLQLAQRLGLDLADALARHRELLADFFQRVVGVHAYAEAHAQHAFLARRQRSQNARGGLAQVRLDRGVDREDGVLVLDEIAEMAVLLVADGRLEGERLLGDFQDFAHLLQRHAQFLGQLLRGRLAADLVEHLPRRAHDLVDGLDHMHRDADGARLVGDRAGDRLADPPGRIGRELVAAAVFEFVDRLHEADIAFLDQIEELQAAVGVFLGDRYHQAQIRLDHFLLRAPRLGLTDRHLAVDVLDVIDRQVMARLDLHQLLLPALDFVLEARQRGGIFLAGLH